MNKQLISVAPSSSIFYSNAWLLPQANTYPTRRRMWSSLFVASLLGLASVAASPVKPAPTVQPLKEVNLFGFDCAKAHGRNAKDACARTNFCLSEAKTQSAKDECGMSFSLRRPLGVWVFVGTRVEVKRPSLPRSAAFPCTLPRTPPS